MEVRPYRPEDHAEWLRMRASLWPGASIASFLEEMAEAVADPERWPVFVAARPDGTLGGFVEASLQPYAPGCDTRPVGYIEGWYVDADLRRTGVGRLLVEAAEAWATSRGCREMASDCEIGNTVSFRAHTALGYREVERVIRFCKRLE